MGSEARRTPRMKAVAYTLEEKLVRLFEQTSTSRRRRITYVVLQTQVDSFGMLCEVV